MSEQNTDYVPLSGEQRRDLYRSLAAANPSADKDEVRKMYRKALRDPSARRTQIDSSGSEEK